MTIGDALPYVAFWVVTGTCLITWMAIRRQRHQHEWKEFDRYTIVVGDGRKNKGSVSYCVCEDCGERKSFYL